MSSQIEILISFLLYLARVGWVGWKSGLLRETVVLVVAFLGRLFLEQAGDIVISLTNFGGKLIRGVLSGGLDDLSAVSSAPDLVTPDLESAYLFGVWVLMVVIVYVISNLVVPNEPSGFAAVVLGMINGLFLISVLLQRFIRMLPPELLASNVDIINFLNSDSLLDSLRGSLAIFESSLGSLLPMMGSQSTLILFGMLTIFLLAAANTLRG
ncbi:MAG: hypothetical protein AAF639_05360 [Chloroflexota bacterium]